MKNGEFGGCLLGLILLWLIGLWVPFNVILPKLYLALGQSGTDDDLALDLKLFMGSILGVVGLIRGPKNEIVVFIHSWSRPIYALTLFVIGYLLMALIVLVGHWVAHLH